jgi:predicted small lipoprotein YifL
VTRRPGRTAAGLLALLLVGATGLPACGRKGPLVAPETRAPAPVADLRAVVRDGAVELAWTVPTSRMDGTRLREVERTRLYRVDDAGAGQPRAALLDGDAVRGWTLLTTVRPTPPAVSLHGQTVVHDDRRDLVAGRRYTYTVTSTDVQGRTSGPSPRVSVRLIAVPDVPERLDAEAGDGRVRLAWLPPGRFRDGGAVTEPLAYEVLRAPSADAPLAVLGRTSPGQASLIDSAVENDRTYWYAVRAVRVEAGTTAEGPATPRVAATPRDATPPSAPTALVAIPSEGRVALSWRASPEADVAGYVVYRTDANGVSTRVGATRAPDTTFTDRPVPPGAYRYEVTAYDTAARPNESARSTPAAVTVP